MSALNILERCPPFCCSSNSNLFREMEAEGILDHLNEVYLYRLHYAFIPKINDRLKSFLEGWNNHSVSTANQQTPSQMLISGVLPQL